MVDMTTMNLLDPHKGEIHSAQNVKLSEDRGIPSGTTDCGIKITSRFWPGIVRDVTCSKCATS